MSKPKEHQSEEVHVTLDEQKNLAREVLGARQLAAKREREREHQWETEAKRRRRAQEKRSVTGRGEAVAELEASGTVIDAVPQAVSMIEPRSVAETEKAWDH